MYSAEGVEELEFQSRLWGRDDYISWLRDGFARMAELRHAGEEHAAFAPLWFRRDSSVRGQLAAFFRMAEFYHKRLHDHFRRAFEEQIRLDSDRRLDDSELAFAAEVWRIYSAMGATGDTIALARLMLRDLDTKLASPEPLETLVEALVTAVAAAPVSGSQISFFEYLYGTRHWREAFALLMAERYFELAGPPARRAWAALLGTYGPSFRHAANPETPAGRAFLGQLALRLKPGETIRLPLTREQARTLAATLLHSTAPVRRGAAAYPRPGLGLGAIKWTELADILDPRRILKLPVPSLGPAI